MAKKIGIIGTGRLGLCFSLILEKAGYDVLGLDIVEDYIRRINEKTLNSFEIGVNELLAESINFKATLDIREVIDFSDIIFITLRTETLPNGKYDHYQIENFLDKLIGLGIQSETKNLVICSNVCPGYSDEVQSRLDEFNYTVSFNPEWVAQGTIIKNQLYPDIIVIGEHSEKVGDKIEEICKDVCLNNPPVHRMDRLSSEIMKIGLNCFLTTKITYANMIGEIALKSGVNPDPILKAIGSDSRINNKYFSYGYGYGGPCFPRDMRALAYYGNKIGIDPIIIKSVMDTNSNHIVFQIKHFVENNDKSIPVIFDSVTYKEGTIIIEESQQLLFAVSLAEEGYEVVIRERKEVIDQVKLLYKDLFIYYEKRDS
jgi:UDPglucose 6-dehydrogenase